MGPPQNEYTLAPDTSRYGYDENAPQLNPTWPTLGSWQHATPARLQTSFAPQTPIQNGLGNISHQFYQQTSSISDFDNQETSDFEQAAAQDENLFQLNIPAMNSMITSRQVVLPQPQHSLICRSGGISSPTPTKNLSNFQALSNHCAQSILSTMTSNNNCTVTVSEGEGLTDDDPELQPLPLKKQKNTRVQSARNTEKKRKQVLELSYIHFKLNLCTDQPFANVVGDLDVCAADAWKTACEELHCMPQTKDCVMQVCGQVKDITQSLVLKTYGFVNIEDCDDDKSDEIKVAQQANHDIYEKLKTKSTFAYLDPNNKTMPNGLYHNKITSKVINKQFFSDAHADGVKYLQYFVQGIPLKLITFILTAV
ncbi:hypothetical protein BDR03DRAFT_1014279 [Suillus americanus]|nr:hypothetical protein BDR03DRAFT_1014279 [Suillus americanus]